ncbi:MAG: glutathione S-transferase [Hyphomicrobiaceae bacterium]
MSEYTLYCFAQSGNAYKAALMLELCKLDWQAKFVDFFNGEARSPDYRAINEMGEVPVLLHGDARLTQTGVILDYLAGMTGRFGAKTPEEGREILRWLFWDNHKLTSYTATYRFLINFAQTGTTPVTQFLEQRMRTAFKVLDERLEDRDWIVGANASIADISACGYLFWPDEFGVDWRDYPGIGAWLERIKAIDGWRAPYDLMPGHADLEQPRD